MLALALGVAGCGSHGKTARTCDPPRAPLVRAVMPKGFPQLEGFVPTVQRFRGNDAILDGYTFVGMDDAFRTVRSAIAHAPGYDVTKTTHATGSASVDFRGINTAGRIVLRSACADRVSVDITAGPQT
jgi:hypothetical protein